MVRDEVWKGGDEVGWCGMECGGVQSKIGMSDAMGMKTG